MRAMNRFRALGLLLLVLPAVTSAAAPPTKMHALLLIADDYENPDDNAIAASIRIDLTNVTSFLGLLERRKLAQVQKTVIRGRNVTRKATLAAIRAMQSGPDDVLFVYFSGHGGMSKGAPFLAMATGDSLDRAELQAAVDARPGRLRVMLLDACTNEVESSVRPRSFKGNATGPTDEGRFDAIYRQLLTGFKGNFYAVASTEGEYAWSDDRTGAVFTTFLVKDGLLKEPKPSWEDLFNTARSKTMQAFHRMDARTVEESKAEGSHNQTPKLLAAPVAIAALPPSNPTSDPTQVPPTMPPPPAEPRREAAAVTLVNRTREAVLVRVDRNRVDEDWTRDRLDRVNLGPGKTLSLPASSVVGFGERRNLVWYELEEGEFAFIHEDGEELTLVQLVDGDVVADTFDVDAFITGTFEVEDGRKVATIEFGEESRFTVRDHRGRRSFGGTWEIDKAQVVDGEELFPLGLTTKEKGREVDYGFAMLVQDENSLVLMLLLRQVDGRETDTSRGPFDEVLVLRRQ